MKELSIISRRATIIFCMSSAFLAFINRSSVCFAREKGIKHAGSKFVQLLGDHWDSNPKRYSVCAAVGCQNSGKSTLLNGIFNTTFPVGSSPGKATTKGIAAQLHLHPNEAPVAVLDVEGTEGRERGSEGPAFDARLLEAAANAADIIIINLWARDLGRQPLKPLLQPVLQGALPQRPTLPLEQEETKRAKGRRAKALAKEDLSVAEEDSSSAPSSQAPHKHIAFIFRDVSDSEREHAGLEAFVRAEVEATLRLHLNLDELPPGSEALEEYGGMFSFASFCNFKLEPGGFGTQCAGFRKELRPLLSAAATSEGPANPLRAAGAAAYVRGLEGVWRAPDAERGAGGAAACSATDLELRAVIEEAHRAAAAAAEPLVARLRRAVDLATVVPVVGFGARAAEALAAAAAAYAASVAAQAAGPGARRGALRAAAAARGAGEARRAAARAAGRLEPVFLDHLAALRAYYAERFLEALAALPPAGGAAFAARAAELRAEQAGRFAAAAAAALPPGEWAAAAGWQWDLEARLLETFMARQAEDRVLEVALVFGEGGEAARRKARAPRWKRLGLQAAVLGVNYFQATQGYRSARAEARRDEQRVPRFPLF